MSQNFSSRVDYIQGLRGLSVLLVLVFHIDPRLVPSGYLGVDAFFAISGYVITRLIHKQFDDNSFSITKFYISRAIRLLPALFIVLIVTQIAFFFIYTPSDNIELAKSSLSATFSISNIFFYLDAGYFSDEAKYKPLLHTWSLGVEEQFYLIWPLTFILLVRTQAIISTYLALVVSLFLVSLFLAKSAPELVFYLSPFRAYEFLIGAWFFLLVRRKGLSFNGLVYSGVLLYSVPVIITVICLADYSLPRTQVLVQFCVASLIALVCAVADLYTNERLRLTSISSAISYIASFFGNSSYSIYLVHWPIIIFLQHFSLSQAFGYELSFALVFVICVSLGWLLHVSLNRIFSIKRSDSQAELRSKLRFVLVLFVASVSVSAYAYYISSAKSASQDEFAAQSSRQLKEQISEVQRTLSCEFDLKHFNFEELREYKACASRAGTNIAVVGDSLSFAQRVILRSIDGDINLTRVYLNGCPPYFGDSPQQVTRMRRALAPCNIGEPFIWHRTISMIVDEGEFDAILISGNWFTQLFGEASYRDSMAVLQSLPVPVLVAGLQPTYREFVPRVLEGKKIKQRHAIDFSKYLVAVKSMPWGEQFLLNSELKLLSTSYPDLHYIDVFGVLCQKGCIGTDTELNPIYTDKQHLSLYGVEYLRGKGLYQEAIEFALER